MSDLDRALADIGAIRDRIARQDGFCSYGPATVAATGVLALAVGTGQALAPAATPLVFLATWVAAAAASIVLVGAEAATRSRRLRSKLADAMILSAAADFVPPGMAGAALLLLLGRGEPGLLWMLPGLWQMLVALGFFAASRALPRSMRLVGAWYLVAGLVTLALGSATHGLSPWAMALPFAVGQALAAALLWRGLERADGL